MCGRFGLSISEVKVLKARFNVSKLTTALRPRYNVAPTQDIASILNEAPDTLTTARWGLVPHWAKDPAIGNRMINARAETLVEKPAFRGLIKSRRCLILADGFYEWKQEQKSGKRPFRITLKDNAPFAFAGLWDVWRQEEKPLVSCTIITTQANSLVSQIHDRMPVILRREDEEKWLKEPNLPLVLELLRPYDAEDMAAYEISKLINSPSNDTPEVTNPL